MSRENVYTAIILKKQTYGEGDELITVLTREKGKMRTLAKSTKFAKSRLQYALQALFYVRLTLTASSLPKIIGAQVLEGFSQIRQDLTIAKIAMYVQELVLKFTPDEEENTELFDLVVAFLGFINEPSCSPLGLSYGLEKFKIAFLETLGLGIHNDLPLQSGDLLGFSVSLGGFVKAGGSSDVVPLSPEAFRVFLFLEHVPFTDLLHVSLSDQGLAELSALVSEFLRYQLERDIKSEGFLRS